MELGIAVRIKPFKRAEIRNCLLKEHQAIVAKLKLPSKVELKSLELLRKAVKLGVAFKRKPNSVAAACVYGAVVLEGSRITQSEIADAARVFEVTVWRVWSALARRLGVDASPRDIATVRAGPVLQVPKPLIKELGLGLGDRVRWPIRRKRLVGEKV